MKLAPVVILLLACSGDDPADLDATASADATITGTDARVDDAMAPQTDASLASVDCATIPAAPISQKILDKPRGYHGLAITTDGTMIGSDGNSLLKSTYDDQRSVFVPGMGYGEQMDWLAGDVPSVVRI